MTLSSHNHPGYVLTPARREHEPGNAQIDIWLAEHPSEAHFDPEQVTLSTLSDEHIDTPVIGHPWSGDRTISLTAGPLTLVDRKNKHIVGFLFGGEMEIELETDCTHVRIKSPAPIMIRNSERPEIVLLIEEANILLARRRAFWADKPEELEHRLAQQNPLTLYAAFLLSMDANFELLPPSDDEILLKARHIIHQELNELSQTLAGFELPLEIIC